MGVICSKGSSKQSPNSLAPSKRRVRDTKSKSNSNSKAKSKAKAAFETETFDKASEKHDSAQFHSSKPHKLKPTATRSPVGGAGSGSDSVPEIGLLLRRASFVGLERAVDVLDTLGSSMTNLNSSSAFVPGTGTRGNKTQILAFEVANTIAGGSNLMQSLSKENIQLLKGEILHSEGVQCLISTDMEELLSIAAADKREELDKFSKEVTRFGNLCKDPQWHKLDRYFKKLSLDDLAQQVHKKKVETTMQQLMSLAHQTSELYHELQTLDRFEQDYQRKLQEETLKFGQTGETLLMLHTEVKRQRKLVRNVQKKSLWSKNLGEVVEKLVDIVTFLHQEIFEAFGNKGATMLDTNKELFRNPQRLGFSGLALHYANIINQIDSIVSRPGSVPPNSRDTLYHGLPAGVKSAFRSHLQTFDNKEELTVSQIKEEMERTLKWIVPNANNTTKAHQGFGWVGEWANAGNEFHKKAAQIHLIRLQTFYHADKEKTDKCILGLVLLLHRLVIQANKDHGSRPLVPVHSPTQKCLSLSLETPKDAYNYKTIRVQISQQEREMLKDVVYRKLVPGISKSQELVTSRQSKRRGCRYLGLSKSSGNSPNKQFAATFGLGFARTNVLDVMDGLSTGGYSY